MEEQWTVKVDKQVTTMLSITMWSNLICIVLLAAVNLLNYFRGNFRAPEAEEGVQRLLSPQILLFISVICVVWLIVRILAARRITKRLENVFLSIDGDKVSGISMPDPAATSREYPNGRPFTLHAREIMDVTSKELPLMKKQLAPALIIRTQDQSFTVPGIALLPEAKSRILMLVDKAASRNA